MEWSPVIPKWRARRRSNEIPLGMFLPTWNSLVDRLQHFNYTADLPRGGIASRRSSPTIMGTA